MATSKDDVHKVDIDFYKELKQAKEVSFEIATNQAPLSKELIPDDSSFFDPKNNLFLQELIDETFETIFITENQENFLCEVSSSIGQVIKLTGVSSKSAEKIYEHCENDNYFNPKAEISRVSKDYIFVLTKNKYEHFDSWTDMLGKTFVFIDRPMTKVEFMKAIIHEFFISLDMKLLLSNQKAFALDNNPRLITFFEYLTNDEYSFKNDKLFNRGAKKEFMDLLGLYPMVLLKFGFSAIRSMYFEELTLRQAGIKTNEIIEYIESDQCHKVFKDVSNGLFDYQDYLVPMHFLIVSPQERRYLARDHYFNREQLKKLQEYFVDQAPSLKNKKTKEKISACTYLSRPVIGNLSTFYNRGPKPRIKGGWSKTLDDSNKKFKTLNDELFMKDFFGDIQIKDLPDNIDQSKKDLNKQLLDTNLLLKSIKEKYQGDDK